MSQFLLSYDKWLIKDDLTAKLFGCHKKHYNYKGN